MMSRKSLFLTLGAVLALFLSMAGVLACLVKHEPSFYHRVAMTPGDARLQLSRKFAQSAFDLANEIKYEKNWRGRFSQDQINSYFEEELGPKGGLGKSLVPQHISTPRVAIDPDGLRMAFRYGGKHWSTIVSVELNVWLAVREPNIIAVEIRKMRAGALPISLQSVLEHFTEVARREGFELNWYRHEGKPVALLRFGPGRSDPSVQLMCLQLQPGAITISGADRSKPATDITPMSLKSPR